MKLLNDRILKRAIGSNISNQLKLFVRLARQDPLALNCRVIRHVQK